MGKFVSIQCVSTEWHVSASALIKNTRDDLLHLYGNSYGNTYERKSTLENLFCVL